MFSRFSQAIVRPPSRNFADGLTSVELGMPDVGLALRQHASYCAALEKHGIVVHALDADDRFPDATFVEDTAVILPGRGAMLTRPGAASRAGEVEAISPVLTEYFGELAHINSPGTLDGGDVCEAGNTVFIGISHRTNPEGARQLGTWLELFGFEHRIVDIRETPGILHLKSGVVAIDTRQLLAISTLATHGEFADFNVLTVPAGEEYAANCMRINDVVFAPKGFPQTCELLGRAGHTIETIEMSEFQKMDGGLTCLSLRF